ncbi:hypothetical protein P154DRAFT_272301 [Amniculicola lignicola CBS 123094]|uniref:Uncharacterized protein n=1 Tax=Amniculicola lignicola CBS 123094 TaxID=1392246 RepID=A0A6A5W7S9_9PLEO|nr:hypothetical protein P154DRAFT_272301 [Amniculicola lignicola CBS 123094]
MKLIQTRQKDTPTDMVPPQPPQTTPYIASPAYRSRSLGARCQTLSPQLKRWGYFDSPQPHLAMLPSINYPTCRKPCGQEFRGLANRICLFEQRASRKRMGCEGDAVWEEGRRCGRICARKQSVSCASPPADCNAAWEAPGIAKKNIYGRNDRCRRLCSLTLWF